MQNFDGGWDAEEQGAFRESGSRKTSRQKRRTKRGPSAKQINTRQADDSHRIVSVPTKLCTATAKAEGAEVRGCGSSSGNSTRVKANHSMMGSIEPSMCAGHSVDSATLTTSAVPLRELVLIKSWRVRRSLSGRVRISAGRTWGGRVQQQWRRRGRCDRLRRRLLRGIRCRGG